MITDIIVLTIIGISALIAYLRGFIRESLTILSMIGATIASFYLGPLCSPIVASWFGEEGAKLFGIIPYSILAGAISYGGIFIIVIIALSILAHILAESAEEMGLGPADKTVGVVFGIARGLFVLAILYLPFHILLGDKTKESWFQDSKTHVYVEKAADWMQAFLPGDVEEDIEKAPGQVEEIVKTGKALKDIHDIHEKPSAEDTGEKSNPMRKLEAFLKGGEAQPEKKQAGQISENTEGGYTQEFRAEMKRLFENSEDNTNYNE